MCKRRLLFSRSFAGLGHTTLQSGREFAQLRIPAHIIEHIHQADFRASAHGLEGVVTIPCIVGVVLIAMGFYIVRAGILL